MIHCELCGETFESGDEWADHLTDDHEGFVGHFTTEEIARA